MDFNCRVIGCDIRSSERFVLTHQHQSQSSEVLSKKQSLKPGLSSVVSGWKLAQVHSYGTLSFICCYRESLPTLKGRGRGSALGRTKLIENSFCGTMTLLIEHALQCHSRTLHSPEQGWVTLHSCRFPPGLCTKQAPWAGTGGMGWGVTVQKGQSLLPVGLGTQRPRVQRAGARHASWRGFNSQGKLHSRENYARFWPLKIWVSFFFREKGLPTGIFRKLTAFQRSLWRGLVQGIAGGNQL